MKDRGDVFVVFIDDDRENIALAKKKIEGVPFTIVPMLVHEEGHLPADSSKVLKAALNASVQAEVPLFVGPASCRFAFAGKAEGGPELTEEVIAASVAASGGS